MKRSRQMIISEILATCCGGSNKTRIVYRANLNFRVADRYMNLLVEKNLIIAKQGIPKLYETTERGKDLLRSLRQIQIELPEA